MYEISFYYSLDRRVNCSLATSQKQWVALRDGAHYILPNRSAKRLVDIVKILPCTIDVRTNPL